MKETLIDKDKVTTFVNEYLKSKTRENRDKIIIECIDLVKYKAFVNAKSTGFAIKDEDLEAYGYIGLINAIDKYSKDKGANFLTYACLRIDWEIKTAMRNYFAFPRQVFKSFQTINDTIASFSQKNHREPTDKELMDVLKLSKAHFKQISEAINMYKAESLSAMIDSPEFDKKLILVDYDNPEKLYNKKELKSDLYQMLHRLPTKDQALIKEIYYKEKPIVQIAKETNKTADCVSIWHFRTIKKLKNMFQNDEAYAVYFS